MEFHQGFIEDLTGAGIADDSVDLVISNCVLNLSPDKPRVFREIFRVLKPGGELLFSDIFADRRIPAPLLEDPVLIGECLSGALYSEDFRRIMAGAGCEDFGQAATYRDTLPEHPHWFDLDDHHRFPAGKPVLVCGNTADMLTATRYAQHFDVIGEKTTHYGLFPCGLAEQPSAGSTSSASACCSPSAPTISPHDLHPKIVGAVTSMMRLVLVTINAERWLQDEGLTELARQPLESPAEHPFRPEMGGCCPLTPSLP